LMRTGDGGPLIGVTLDGAGGNNISPLDMQSNSSQIHVQGRLTLGGALLRLGNAGGGTIGQLAFQGAAQTIDGTAAHPATILFGGNAGNSNALFSETGSALTFGPNLTVTGATGRIFSSAGFDLQGAVTADPSTLGLASGTIELDGSNWVNHGAISAQNGGNLNVFGRTSTTSPAFTNAPGHTISITGGSLTLRGDSTTL